MRSNPTSSLCRYRVKKVADGAGGGSDSCRVVCWPAKGVAVARTWAAPSGRAAGRALHGECAGVSGEVAEADALWVGPCDDSDRLHCAGNRLRTAGAVVQAIVASITALRVSCLSCLVALYFASVLHAFTVKRGRPLQLRLAKGFVVNSSFSLFAMGKDLDAAHD